MYFLERTILIELYAVVLYNISEITKITKITRLIIYFQLNKLRLLLYPNIKNKNPKQLAKTMTSILKLNTPPTWSELTTRAIPANWRHPSSLLLFCYILVCLKKAGNENRQRWVILRQDESESKIRGTPHHKSPYPSISTNPMHFPWHPAPWLCSKFPMEG